MLLPRCQRENKAKSTDRVHGTADLAEPAATPSKALWEDNGMIYTWLGLYKQDLKPGLHVSINVAPFRSFEVHYSLL